jgi:Vibrio phage DNA polymerase
VLTVREPAVRLFDVSDVDALLKAHRVADRSGSNSRKPRSIGTYDTETDPFHHCDNVLCPKCWGRGRVPKPFLHGFYLPDTEEYEEFETIEDVIRFVEDKRMIFYAHNGGRFDYHPLRPYMNTDEPVMLINGRIARFRIGEAEFRDSLNIFPNTRLKDFGVKNEIDYAKMEPGMRDQPAVREEISLYMRQDCVGLADQVTRYRREYGKSLTQAGASMKYWEKHHHEDKAPRQTKGQFERCRPFYYGGRVQCFESGVRAVPFKVADLNSAYPRAMLERHPLTPQPSHSQHLPRDEAHLRTALIRLQCTARGCFPWRDPDTGELYFPEDESLDARPQLRRYFITGWEFLAALELDAVTNISIEEVLTFDQLVSFKDYIEHHYHARMEAAARGDLAGKIFGKYFMNSLYGKFGADPSNYAEYLIATTDTIDAWKAKGYGEYQPWGDGRWMMERKPSPEQLEDIQSKWRYYNVATAASITGYVRAALFRALSVSSGAIYCDTDSIAARDTQSLSYGGNLGEWKDEGAFDRYAIAGKKLYAFHVDGREESYDPSDEKNPSWKIASKGVAFHAMTDGPDQIMRLAQGGEVVYRPQTPTYSICRADPVFINRTIRSTVKDIRHAPDLVL